MGGLRIEGLEAATDPDRLFPIRTQEGYGFYAGRASGGQLLIAAAGEKTAVVVWDVDVR